MNAYIITESLLHPFPRKSSERPQRLSDEFLGHAASARQSLVLDGARHGFESFPLSPLLASYKVVKTANCKECFCITILNAPPIPTVTPPKCAMNFANSDWEAVPRWDKWPRMPPSGQCGGRQAGSRFCPSMCAAWGCWWSLLKWVAAPYQEPGLTWPEAFPRNPGPGQKPPLCRQMHLAHWGFPITGPTGFA